MKYIGNNGSVRILLSIVVRMFEENRVLCVYKTNLPIEKQNFPTLSMYSETFLKRTLNKPSNVWIEWVIVV